MKINSSQIFRANDQYMALDKFWKNIVKERGITGSRQRINVIYRHTFSCVCYDISTLPIVQISSILDRDHATVIHAVKNNEHNRKYDHSYETIYIWMHNEISQILKSHIDENAMSILTRVRDRNPEIDIDTLLEGVNRDWTIKMSLLKEENIQLKKENKSLSKYANSTNQRNKLLESELKRVKNLI